VIGSLLAAALARAQNFVVTPPAAAPPLGPGQGLHAVPAPAASVRVAVVGLSRGSGATTVSLGLARALLVPAVRTAHLLSFAALPERSAGEGVTHWEVPAALREPREVAEYGATVERLAGPPAALVWDVAVGESERGVAAIGACDCVVAVAAASAEPALAGLVCTLLGERYGRVVLIANRVRYPEAWSGRCAVALPESRIGALLAVRGRMPGGGFGAALRQVAGAVEAEC
jgi:hypothetical protein